MRYSQSSSRIVFTDLMVLLLSVILGLNSMMTFAQENREKDLPPVNLPSASKAMKGEDSKTPGRAFVTITAGKAGAKNSYFYNGRKVDPAELGEILEAAKVHSVVLRADRDASFKWEELCRLKSDILIKAGVKMISYAVTEKEGGDS